MARKGARKSCETLYEREGFQLRQIVFMKFGGSFFDPPFQFPLGSFQIGEGGAQLILPSAIMKGCLNDTFQGCHPVPRTFHQLAG